MLLFLNVVLLQGAKEIPKLYEVGTVLYCLKWSDNVCLLDMSWYSEFSRK